METNGTEVNSESKGPAELQVEEKQQQIKDQNPQVSSIKEQKVEEKKDTVTSVDGPEDNQQQQQEPEPQEQPQEALTSTGPTNTATKSTTIAANNTTTSISTSDNGNVSLNDTKNNETSSLMDTSEDVVSQDSQLDNNEDSSSPDLKVKQQQQTKKAPEESNDTDKDDVDESLSPGKGGDDDDAQNDKSPETTTTKTKTATTNQNSTKQKQQQPKDTKTNSNPTDTGKEKSNRGRKPRNIRSELDRLLQDEGTVKILMGGGRSSRKGGHQAIASPSGDSPATKEAKLSELQKNRDLIASQVREGSRTKLFSKVSLRQKAKSRRQLQQEEKEEKSKKAKLEPSSKIIRRRSSSSNFNFSSRSPSPVHPNAVTIQSSSEDSVQFRIQDSVGYITVSAEATKFNSQVTGRVTHILNSLKADDTVSIVQLTTTNGFIQGIDIEEIISEKDDGLRESMADSMIACLDTLVKVLINYPKILVAGVSGDAIDFGVIILQFFDLVYASDKATFQTNYTKNEYLPECLQFFPRNRLTHAMLYTGKKLTATEGLTSGLVTEVLWPAKFQAELSTRIRTMASSNQQILLRTKTELAQKKNSNKLELLTKELRSSWLKQL